MSADVRTLGSWIADLESWESWEVRGQVLKIICRSAQIFSTGLTLDVNKLQVIRAISVQIII
jgi:hypothetical protein